jgi:hypothetical protein
LTFPIELSAYLSCSAATFDANVSKYNQTIILSIQILFLPGKDVPNATKAIAVIVSVKPTVQPNYR